MANSMRHRYAIEENYLIGNKCVNTNEFATLALWTSVAFVLLKHNQLKTVLWRLQQKPAAPFQKAECSCCRRHLPDCSFHCLTRMGIYWHWFLGSRNWTGTSPNFLPKDLPNWFNSLQACGFWAWKFPPSIGVDALKSFNIGSVEHVCLRMCFYWSVYT